MRVDSSSLPNNLTQASGGVATSAAEGDKNQFLRLLVAQLEHQDPLQPQEGADFIAQLAQFSSLEQATETNQRLTALADAQASNQRAGLTELVGRTVTANADSIQLDPSSGALPEMNMHLDASASNVDIVIKDAAGHEVRTIHAGARAAGDTPLGWDGKGANGETLPAGTYSFEITAVTGKGAPVGAHTQVVGRVSSVKFDNGATTFAIGSAVIPPGAIVSVEE